MFLYVHEKTVPLIFRVSIDLGKKVKAYTNLLGYYHQNDSGTTTLAIHCPHPNK